MIKIYYAHSMHIYGSEQEQRDIALLESLGFEVVNPNSAEHMEKVKEIQVQHEAVKKDPGATIMDYFYGVVRGCQALAFRGLFNGDIPAGVWKEIGEAKSAGLPIIELPHLLDSRALSVNDTRAILGYNGQR